ncbi:MAG: hypothetical protein PHI32_13890 [Dysgonamonadaceae bacterium]|nr:hypothetical protein [Dysgonamonadaceae bacterium]
MAYFSLMLYDNIVEMEYWIRSIYKFYSIPFQIIIPLFVWVCAEIKSRKSSKAARENCEKQG